jgi:hypothetical protein
LTFFYLAGKIRIETHKKQLTLTELARLGGKARAKKLTPEQRSEIAKKAVAAQEAIRQPKR